MTWWFYGCSYTAGHEINDTAVRNEDGTLTSANSIVHFTENALNNE